MSRHRTTLAAVLQMAAVNHVPCVRRSHFASVQLAGETYFWSA